MPLQKLEVCLGPEAAWVRCGGFHAAPRAAWQFDPATGLMRLVGTSQCLAVAANSELHIQPCERTDDRWTLRQVLRTEKDEEKKSDNL